MMIHKGLSHKTSQAKFYSIHVDSKNEINATQDAYINQHMFNNFTQHVFCS